MKTISDLNKIVFIATLVAMAMIFITNPVFSQDSSKKPHPKKQIKVVVQTDKNGRSHILDTTINLNGRMDEANLRKVMKEYDIDLEGLADNMQDMVVQIDDMDLPDSAKVDSLCKMVKKIRIIGREGNGPMCKRGHERSHSYKFDYYFNEPGIPDSPPPPPPPPPIGDFDFFDNASGFEPLTRNFEEKGTTLSDIIGDIPMDMVKSYSIKETKNGKKIVIELNNYPIIERRDKVIIIREPGQRRPNDHSRNPHMRKKVIIRSDGGEPKEESPKM